MGSDHIILGLSELLLQSLLVGRLLQSVIELFNHDEDSYFQGISDIVDFHAVLDGGGLCLRSFQNVLLSFVKVV